MKSILLKSIMMVTVLGGLVSGCTNSDTYDIPETNCVEPALTPTKTVEDIIAMVTSIPTAYPDVDDVIEAYVTTSDEKGNIYKSISFQTNPADGSEPVGFSVPINATSTFGQGFVPGRKVYIKLKGLYIAKVYGSLQIGSIYQSSPSSPEEIGRIHETEYKNFLFPSCTTQVSEEDLIGEPMTISEAVSDANLNRLIELEDVQFVDSSIGRTYFDVDSGGGSTNHMISSTSGGTPLVLRISSFAPFSGKLVPEGSGNIRGVLTKFESTYQFMIRYESDVRLTEPRVDSNPPVVGNAIEYLGSFTENFESYTAGSATTGQFNFPKYINDPLSGSKLWRVRSASGNKYIEMSSFGNPAENNRTLFVVPVDMTAANTFSLQTRTNFYVGQTLKVFYSMNYVPGADIATANLVDITSSFAISTANTSTSPFTNSGVYNIPAALTGNGFFIFQYTGSGLSTPALTTNMQIDNIVVN